MKNLLKKLNVLMLISGLLIPAFSFGQEAKSLSVEQEMLVQKTVEDTMVTLGDLGIENPGLLQTNPFYFMKNLKYSTWRTFSFNAFKKADTELDILNERAAEIKRLPEIVLDSEASLQSSLSAYQQNIESLETYLLNIQNPKDYSNFDTFLHKLIRQSILHFRIFDALRTKDNFILNEKIGTVQNRLAAMLTRVEFAWETGADFKQRLDKAIQDIRLFPLSGLMHTAALNYIVDANNTSELRESVIKFQEELLLHELGVMKRAGLDDVLAEIFARLPGNTGNIIQALDQMREYVSGNDQKNQLGLIRQSVLDETIKNKLIGKVDAEQLLARVSDLVLLADQKITAFSLKNSSFQAIVTRAKFNLTQAKSSFASNQYGIAFGQASLAAAAIDNAVAEARFFSNVAKENFELEISSLKSTFDRLNDAVKEKNLEADQDIAHRMETVEQQLAQYSDALGAKKINTDFLVSAVRATRGALAEIEYIVAHH